MTELRGSIKAIPPGQTYGFILGDNGVEYFFLASVLEGAAFASLNVDERVIFTPIMHPKGRRAARVRLERLEGIPMEELEDGDTEEYEAARYRGRRDL